MATNKPEASGARTIIPNGAKIRRLRLAKGWNVNQMVLESGLSKRTIGLVENNHKCFMYTLNMIAKALGAKAHELTLHPLPDSPSARDRISITIKVPASHSDAYDIRDIDVQQLICVSIEMQTARRGELEVMDMDAQKSQLTINMNIEGCNELIRLFQQVKTKVERHKFSDGIDDQEVEGEPCYDHAYGDSGTSWAAPSLIRHSEYPDDEDVPKLRPRDLDFYSRVQSIRLPNDPRLPWDLRAGFFE